MYARVREALRAVTCAALVGVTVTAVGAPARATVVAACATAQLRLISDDRNGAGGHLVLYFRLRNISDSACTLFGFPGVRLLDHRGLPRFPVAWSAADFFGRTRERRVRLRPGRVASFRIVSTSRPQGCDRAAAAVQVFAPNTAAPLTVRLDDWVGACDVTVIPIQPGASYGHPG